MTPEERAEWLAWRREGLGGSDIAAIIGLSPWKSPYALWAEKVGLIEDEDESEQMEFGRDAEPMMSNWFRRTHPGLDLAGEQMWLTNPEHKWMRATPDGFVFEEGGVEVNEWGLDVSDALALHEIKVTSQTPEEWEAEIPDHYRAQAQWLLAVSGYERVYFSVLHTAFGRMKRRPYVIARNDEDIAYLQAEGEKFWALVQSGVPPDIDGSEATTHALQRAFEPDRGESVELDDELFGDLLSARDELARWEQEVARASNLVKATMQSATEGTIEGHTVCSWRPSKAMNVPRLLEELGWDEAVKTLDAAGFEVADHLKLDLAGWTRANRKRAAALKTEPGGRRFLLSKTKDT